MASGEQLSKNWERWVIKGVIALAIVGTFVSVVEGGVDPVPVAVLDTLLVFAIFS